MPTRRILAVTGALALSASLVPALAAAEDQFDLPFITTIYEFHGATCDDPAPTDIGATVTVTYCVQALEDDGFSPVPGAIVTVSSDGVQEEVKLDDQGQITVDVPETDVVFIHGHDLNPVGRPFIALRRTGETPAPGGTPGAAETPAPGGTPGATETPAPGGTPSDPMPTVDPNDVDTFGMNGCGERVGSYEPGTTYEFTACNPDGQPVTAGQVNIYSTADGAVENLDQGTLIDTVDLSASQGVFSLTIPETGYIGVVADSGVALIIGPDPRGGDQPTGNDSAGDSGKSDAPVPDQKGQGTAKSGGAKGGKGLPKTGL